MRKYPTCYIQLAKTAREVSEHYAKEAHFYMLDGNTKMEQLARIRSDFFRYYAEQDERALRTKEDSANA